MGRRKRTLFIVAALIMTVGFLLGDSVPVSAQVSSDELPAGYTWHYYPGTGHYYSFNQINYENNRVFYRMTWGETQDEATSMGGYLVTILDEGENEWLKSIIDFHSTSFWIGYKAGTGWITGEQSSYVNWRQNYDDVIKYPESNTYYALFYPIPDSEGGTWHVASSIMYPKIRTVI